MRRRRRENNRIEEEEVLVVVVVVVVMVVVMEGKNSRIMVIEAYINVKHYTYYLGSN